MTDVRVALKNVDLLIKTDWSMIYPLRCRERWPWVGRRQQSESIGIPQDLEVRRLDGPF